MLELLYKRRSVRKYKEEKVEEEKVEKILKAALLSPSGRSLKPWEMIVVDDREALARLSKAKKSGAALIEGAPLAIAVIADEEKSGTWIEDTSILCTIMQLEIEKLGLGSCWVQIRMREDADGNKSEDIVKNILGIPERFRVEAIVAIGYKDEEKKAYTEADIDMAKVSYGRYNNRKA